MTLCEDSSSTSFSPSSSFDNTNERNKSNNSGFKTRNNIQYLQMDQLDIGYSSAGSVNAATATQQLHHHHPVNQFSHALFTSFPPRPTPPSTGPSSSSSTGATSTTSAAAAAAAAGGVAASASVTTGSHRTTSSSSTAVATAAAAAAAAATAVVTNNGPSSTSSITSSSLSSSLRSSPIPLGINAEILEHHDSTSSSSSSPSSSSANKDASAISDFKSSMALPSTVTNEEEREDEQTTSHDEIAFDTNLKATLNKPKTEGKSSFSFLKQKLASVINPLQSPFLHIFSSSSSSSPSNDSSQLRQTHDQNEKSTSTTDAPLVASLIGTNINHNLKSLFSSKFFTMKRIITFLVLSVSIVFLTLFAQGISHLMTYRNHFGHAPIPQSPSHGVIVAYPKNVTISNNGNIGNDAAINAPTEDPEIAMSNYTFKAFHPSRTTSSSPLMMSTQPPLRLLVIGDSLARGVGQAHNCYPILPQSLAKYLSSHLNGRIIYWTAMAKPGASTNWLSSLVEEEVKRKIMNGNHNDEKIIHSLKQFKDMHLSTTSSTTTTTTTTTSATTTSMKSTSNDFTKKDWISTLQYHQKLYEQNPFGDYDIVIVMSGLNDIKRILVPFMFDDEVVETDDNDGEAGNNEQHQAEQKEKERGFAADMKRLIHLLNYGKPQDHHLTKLSNSCVGGASASSITTKSNSDIQVAEQTCTVTNNDEVKPHRELPMIVFPRFPTNINPVKMGSLLRMVAIYLSGLMDHIKKRISNQYMNVISPEPPGPRTAYDYLQKHPDNDLGSEGSGELVNQKSDIMVNLIDMKCTECERREQEMSEFYSKRRRHDFCIPTPVEKLFAPDGLHPR